MTFSRKNILVIIFAFQCSFSFAQQGTRNAEPTNDGINGKIMLIPFEPKLYMSEIDQKINQQTKWNFNQIRENFRHQLDAQLKLNLQSILPVVTFYSDSAKMSKDLEYIYRSTNLSYDIVGKPTAETTPATSTGGIKNGQLAVEVNEDKKFMNTKLSNSELLDYLNKKYKTEFFVFVNELDITNDMNSYNLSTDTYQRVIQVHYSILDKSGKIISAGLTTSGFSSKENNPKKIVSLGFTPIARSVAEIFAALPGIQPKK